MTIIVVMPDILPLAEIKAHLSEIVDRVEREHDRVVLTRNGRPAAVIMSPADLGTRGHPRAVVGPRGHG